MNKINRIEIVSKNIAICDKGKYTSSKKYGVPKKVNIKSEVELMKDKSKTFTAEEGKELLEREYVGVKDCKFYLKDESVVDTVFDNATKSIGVLNFASARHPGGGYLYGSMAQEEALCYASALYHSLEGKVYYAINEQYKGSDYTDTFIYSPDVPFFRDSEFELVKCPVLADVLTMPAVNRTNMRADLSDKYDETMKRRMSIILRKFIEEGVTTVILGAYGCGVFANSPEFVAKAWRELLIDEHLDTCFDEVIFSICKNANNFNTFKKVWSDKLE